MFSVIFHYNTWRENQEKTTKGAFKVISASSTLSRGCVSSYLCADTQGPALALFLPFLSWFRNDNTCLLVLGSHSKYSKNELADSLSDSLPPQPTATYPPCRREGCSPKPNNTGDVGSLNTSPVAAHSSLLKNEAICCPLLEYLRTTL